MLMPENHIQIDEQVAIPLNELSFRYSRSSGPGGHDFFSAFMVDSFADGLLNEHPCPPGTTAETFGPVT